jgi:hypothetical protein
MLIFITVDIFKHTAKKIRKLNEQIKFYLKCMVPLYVTTHPQHQDIDTATHIYVTTHLPDLVQALQLKVAGLN